MTHIKYASICSTNQQLKQSEILGVATKISTLFSNKNTEKLHIHLIFVWIKNIVNLASWNILRQWWASRSWRGKSSFVIIITILINNKDPSKRVLYIILVIAPSIALGGQPCYYCKKFVFKSCVELKCKKRGRGMFICQHLSKRRIRGCPGHIVLVNRPFSVVWHIQIWLNGKKTSKPKWTIIFWSLSMVMYLHPIHPLDLPLTLDAVPCQQNYSLLVSLLMASL